MRIAFAAFDRACRLEEGLRELLAKGWTRDELSLMAHADAPVLDPETSADGGAGSPSSRLLGDAVRHTPANGEMAWRANDSRLSRLLLDRPSAAPRVHQSVLAGIMSAASAEYFQPFADAAAHVLFVEVANTEREKEACAVLLEQADSDVHTCDLPGPRDPDEDRAREGGHDAQA